MHLEILNKNQLELLPFLKLFENNFGLVGGTAIALHIGHRRSVDFDLFSFKVISKLSIQRIILKANKKVERIFVDEKTEYTILIDGVKMTFLQYPFEFEFKERFEKINLPDLLTLAALKAYALGRRAKWKDYVDMYFILNNYFSIKDVVQRADKIFGNNFNEKIFRTQLAYFKDIDYSEKVEYLKGFEVSDAAIKKSLVNLSLS
jgi:hypothetical protein